MKISSRMFGAAFLVLFIYFALALSGKVGIYIDYASIIFITGVLVGGVLISFSWQQIADAFTAVFKGNDAQRVSAWQQQMRVAVFSRLYLLAWGSGLIGTLIGVIAMLSDLSDFHSIGRGVAVALMTILYGAMLAELVFGPMQQVVMNQPPDGEAPETEPLRTPSAANTQSTVWKGAAIIAFVGGIMGILMISTEMVKPSHAEAQMISDQELTLEAEQPNPE